MRRPADLQRVKQGAGAALACTLQHCHWALCSRCSTATVQLCLPRVHIRHTREWRQPWLRAKESLGFLCSILAMSSLAGYIDRRTLIGCSRSLRVLSHKTSRGALRRGGLLLSAGSVRHFPIPGVLTLQGGAREAVIMHVYLRSQPRGDVVVFRGFMFAESVERDWYSLLDGYVCQPDVSQDAWPGIVLRCGCVRAVSASCGPLPAWSQRPCCSPVRAARGEQSGCRGCARGRVQVEQRAV